uniref:Uncharacterized protein n=1 Tax=Setaria italica TaxID=4555 RepID=K3YBF8_SETIT
MVGSTLGGISQHPCNGCAHAGATGQLSKDVAQALAAPSNHAPLHLRAPQAELRKTILEVAVPNSGPHDL